MSAMNFAKDLRGYYGMLIVQGATQEETEQFHGMSIEDIQEYSELPIGGLLCIEAHVRSTLELSTDRIEDFWDVPVRVFISDSMVEGDAAVVIRDLLSEITQMVDEDRDCLRDLWEKQRPRWDSPENPSELRRPVAESSGEESPQKYVDGS